MRSKINFDFFDYLILLKLIFYVDKVKDVCVLNLENIERKDYNAHIQLNILCALLQQKLEVFLNIFQCLMIFNDNISRFIPKLIILIEELKMQFHLISNTVYNVRNISK